MRGFQLFTTGMQEVGKEFHKRNRGTVTTKYASVVEHTPIYKTVRKAEKALFDHKSEIFKIPKETGKGHRTFAKDYYLMEVEFDEHTNKVDHWISIWAYSPYKKTMDEEDYEW